MMSSDARTELKVTRLNQSFLLKEMLYSQHFTYVYVARHEALRNRIIENAKSHDPNLKPARILEISSDEQKLHKLQKQQLQQNGGVARVTAGANAMMIGKERLLIGTLFKNMPSYRTFLTEYRAELVRLRDGDGDDDEDGDEGGEGGDDDAGVEMEDILIGDMMETQEITGEKRLAQDAAIANSQHASQLSQNSSAYKAEWPRINSERDTLILEDDSGRIELGGANVRADLFTTGVIVGVAGAVNERGIFIVNRFFTAEAARPPPVTILPSPCEPVYLAFVCGLNITGLGAAPPSIELLIDFFCGNIGDKGAIGLASRIARVIIGGGLITETEESKLAQKVKLEPTDHSRLSEVANCKISSHSASSAGAMRHADRLVALLSRSVPVELMPGPTDATNCFLPQQPIHPLMLREGANADALRLVTNPFQFETQLEMVTTNKQNTNSTANNDNDDAAAATTTSSTTAASFLVSSGQNVSDVIRQTSLSSVEAMQSLLKWGHLCPTAPNTLSCFPYKEKDPFVTPVSPHCFVACNQEKYESVFKDGVRFVSVPKYQYLDQLVLVNVASPTFETRVVTLNLKEE